MDREVRELPILFRGDMVSAILSGDKTQTRRVITPQPRPATVATARGTIAQREVLGVCEDRDVDWLKSPSGEWVAVYRHHCALIKKPRYQVGDLLWVKEYHRFGRSLKDAPKQGIVLYGDGAIIPHPDLAPERLTWCRKWKGRSSLFLPRWAARIWLRVTAVRSEQLQDISVGDCIAEGVCTLPSYRSEIERDGSVTGGSGDLPRRVFASLWDEINEKRGFGWEVNPWLFVYTFELERVVTHEQATD